MNRKPPSELDKLRAAVIASGRTQTDLARASGLPQSSISDLVSGKLSGHRVEAWLRLVKVVGRYPTP